MVNETEAAIYLGITKELLYSFVKTGYNGLKLNVHSDVKNNFFTVEDLKNWNEFLHKPLIIQGEKRPEIPLAIKEYLKVESRGKCARCGSGHRLDNAHIISWSESFSHHPHNLIRLCTDCHTKYDDGIISKEEIITCKNQLIQRIKDENIEIDLNFNTNRQLKPNPNFKGRFQELEELNTLFSQNNFICIEGVGGIGKTQLLLKFIQTKKIEVNWFNVEGFSGFSDFINELFIRFHVSNFSQFLDTIENQSAIIIFDGIETLWSIFQDKTTEFLKFLNDNICNAKIVFTTQFNHLDFDNDLQILKLSEGLNWDDTFEILKEKNQNLEISDEWVSELISFSDGHPLTIKLIAGLIYRLGSPEKVCRSIKEIGLNLFQNPNFKDQKKSTSLELCFNLSYRILNEKQKWLLMYLSLFPVGYKECFLDVLIIDKKSTSEFKSSTELMMSLAVLSQFNLIEKEVDILNFSRIKMLNPIRIFIRNKVGSNSKELLHKIQIEAFQHSVLDAVALYQTYMLSDKAEYGIMRYEIELQNYIYAFKKAVHSAYCKDCQKYCNRKDYLHIITGFSSGLYKYLFTRGKIKYGIEINKQGAKAHIELKEFDLAIDDLTQVATLNWRIQNIEEMEQALDEMRRCETLSGEKFASVRLVEGELMREKNPLAAIKIFEEGIEICENNLRLDPHHLSSSANIGSFYMEIGRTYENYLNDSTLALDFYLKAHEISKDIKDFANMYCSSHHIGNCYANIEDFKKSLYFYKEALQGFVKYGQQEYIGNSLYGISKVRKFGPGHDYSFLTEELLIAGLHDIKNEIIEAINFTEIDNREDLNGGLDMYLVRKLWGIINVISLSKTSSILKDWASSLIEIFEAKYISQGSYPFMFLEIAIALCDLENDKKNEEKIAELKDRCYFYGSEVDHELLEPYSFLSLWFKEKGILDISRGELYREIEDGTWDYEDEEEDY